MSDPSKASPESRWRQFVEEAGAQKRADFIEHRSRFREIYRNRSKDLGPPPAWFPGEEVLRRSHIAELMAERGCASYQELHRWSIEDRSGFWERVVERLGLRFETKPRATLELTDGVESPRWLPGARLNIVDSCFVADPGKEAIRYREESSEGPRPIRSMSYGELEAEVNRFANGLREHGFQPGAALALYMPMNLECVIAYLGIVRAGGRVVSVADSFSAQELHKRMEIAKARGLVTVQSYRRAGRQIDLYPKVEEALSRFETRPKAIVVSGSDGSRLHPEDRLWDEFLSKRREFTSEIASPDAVTNVLFSSGTSGTPKAIPWTHVTPIKAGMDAHFHQDVHHQDVVCWPTNIGWMMGPWLIYATFLNRATMALYGGAPTGEGFIRFVQESRVSVLGVVPAIVRHWRARASVGFDAWEDVRLFSSTGEASSAEDYLWLMSRAGYRAPVIEYLGGTEIGGGHLTGTVVQPASPATFTTAALGLDFVVLDESGKEVEEGEMGELFLIPPSIGLSQALLDDFDKLEVNRNHHQVYYADCPPGPRGETLRRHGDQIARLAKGYYKAQGRADDTMNLGGIKVSSLELEEVVNDHPAVYESAAVAVQPEGEGADRLVVYVVLKERSERDDLAAELSARIASVLNPLFKVHDVVEREELPRTASNKIMRRRLRAEYETS